MARHKLGCVWSRLACMYIILFWSSNIHLILHIALILNNMQIINIIYTDTSIDRSTLKNMSVGIITLTSRTYFGFSQRK